MPEGSIHVRHRDRTQVKKTDAEWRAELTPMQYAVLREKAPNGLLAVNMSTKPGALGASCFAPAAADLV